MANAIDQSSISHRRVPLLRNLEKGEVFLEEIFRPWRWNKNACFISEIQARVSAETGKVWNFGY